MWIYCSPPNDRLGHESICDIMSNGNWKCNILIIYLSQDFVDVSAVVENTSSTKLVSEDDIRDLSRGLKRQEAMKSLIIRSDNSMDAAKQRRELGVMLASLRGIGFLSSLSIDVGEVVMEKTLGFIADTKIRSLVVINTMAAGMAEKFGKSLSKSSTRNGERRDWELIIGVDDVKLMALLRGFDELSWYHHFATTLGIKAIDRNNRVGLSMMGVEMLGRFLGNDSCPVKRFVLEASLSNFFGAMGREIGLALKKNRVLQEITLNTVTMRGSDWATTKEALCDVSSIQKTYKSNHVLRVFHSLDHEASIGSNDVTPAENVSEDVGLWLRWNCIGERYAQHKKVITYHFGSRLDIESFLGFENSRWIYVAKFFRRSEKFGVEEDIIKSCEFDFYFRMMQNMHIVRK